MIVKILFLVLTAILCLTAQPGRNPKDVDRSDSGTRKDTSLIRFVNPMIGTRNMGHTYPGATARRK